MSDPTTPAVSEAMREAVAQWLRDRFPLNGWQSTAQAIALLKSGPIASEIARLTGERDAMDRDVTDMMWQRRRAEERAEAAEAALSRLQADRDAEVGKLADARRHAISLEQCALFVDSPPLRRSMTEAAAFLRSLATEVRTALTETPDA